MRRPVALLLSGLIVAISSAVVQHSTASAATATVEGVVTDTSGNPIAGATVLVQRQPNESYGLTATSGVDGHYSISGLFDGTWKVVAAAPGYAARFGNAASWDDGASIDVTIDGTIPFDVQLPRTSASISGVVTDPDGAPVPGVQVQANPAPGFGPTYFLPFGSGLYAQAITDADGAFALPGLAPSSFVVSFTTQYYGDTGPTPPSPFVNEVYLDAADPSGATFVVTSEDAVTSGIDAQLNRGATVSGLVTDANGDPMPNVAVVTNSLAEFGGVFTDEQGRYTLIGVPGGDTELRAYDSESSRIAVYHAPGAVDQTQIHIDLGVDYTGFDIQFESVETVFVTVLGSGGALEQGAMVACRDPGMPVVVPPPLPFWSPNVECTSGPLLFPPGSSREVQLPLGTYNAVGTRGAGGFDPSQFALSDVTTFTLVAGVPLDCTFVLDGVASCAATDPTTIDGDSVAAIVEDGAPNGGDGNADGIRDATQSNVTSLPSYLDDGFVTFVVAPNLQITLASVTAPTSPAFMPETGSMRVRIGGLPLGGATDLTILRTNVGPADELSSFDYSGPSFPTRKPIPADFDGNTIVTHLVDGNGFDAPWDITGSGVADGSITLDATPVVGDHTPPVITCPSPAPTFQLGRFGFVTATVSDVGSGVAGSTILQQFVFAQAIGTSSVTFNASDVAGNTTTQTCDYVVVAVPIDDVPPTIQCFGTPSFEVGQLGFVQAFAFDNVGIVGSSFLSQLADTSQPGNFAATFSASDIAGNTTTTDCPYVVLGPPPLDLTPPTIVCPETPEFQTGQFAILYANAYDDVAPLQQLVYQYVDTSTAGEFSTTMYATDYAGNTASKDCSYRVVGPPPDRTPPTIVCPDSLEFQVGIGQVFVFANAYDDVGPTVQWIYFYADTSEEGDFTVTLHAWDYAGNEAVQDCSYRVLGDLDDVDSVVEDGAPNGGDGNADGVPDRNQRHVTSLAEPDGDGYVTVVNAYSAQQHLVSSSTVAEAGPTPPGIDLIGGAYDVRFDYPYASLYVVRSEEPVYPQLAAWNGAAWTRWPGFAFDGDALDLDGPYNGTVTLRFAPAEIDSTPPRVECPSDTPHFLLNDPAASINVAVSDDGSGVDSPVVTVPVDASSLGDRSAFVIASDRIGNTNYAFCPYRVGVDIALVSPGAGDSLKVKAGKVAPIVWRASDFNGDPVTTDAHFVSITGSPVDCPRGRETQATTSGSGGPFQDDAGLWRYGFTAPTGRGCYLVRVDVVGDSATGLIRVH
jgi:protocatechuate 3,4-dioxygenase beta subunit